MRVPDQHDKRHKRVYLTHQGKCVQQALYACAHQTLEKACEGIEQQELNACRKVLIKMFHNLNTPEISFKRN
ncbi:MAG: hypothetical protein D6730_05890 [Bacteroidetes bacterium]|nr:MAG: hypothetical protein D6730_05890 [Bacteroidota bacterium]